MVLVVVLEALLFAVGAAKVDNDREFTRLI